MPMHNNIQCLEHNVYIVLDPNVSIYVSVSVQILKHTVYQFMKNAGTHCMYIPTLQFYTYKNKNMTIKLPGTTDMGLLLVTCFKKQ